MSAGLGVLRRGFAAASDLRAEAGTIPCKIPERAADEGRQPTNFARDQIRGLVRSVFVPGWPRPARQVVFSGAERGLDVTSVCIRTGQALAAEGAGKVCLVETDLEGSALEKSLGGTSNDGSDCPEAAGAVRKSSRQISPNLWLVPGSAFLGTREKAHSFSWLSGRMGELRREFDYSIIHAPNASDVGDAALLAHLADGLILALEAHRTRRATAQRIRQQLFSANVRLLGVVLQDRTFPIPESLYRRL